MASLIFTSGKDTELSGGLSWAAVSVSEQEAEDHNETHGEDNARVEEMFLQTELSQDLGHTPPKSNVLLVSKAYFYLVEGVGKR